MNQALSDIDIGSRQRLLSPLVVNFAIYLVLYAAFALVIVHKPTELGGSDYWMHAGSVAVFSEDLFSPQHTYDEADTIRVRNFSPYQFLLASSVRGFSISPVDATIVGALLSLAILFGGLWFVARRFGDNPWLPAGLLIGVMFLVGTGFKWSTEIDATVLPRFASYPSTVSLGLAFICWATADLLLTTFTWYRFAAVALLTGLVFLIHQFVFLFMIVMLFFWALPRIRDWRAISALALAIATGLTLTLLWPYFNPFDVAWSAAVGGGGGEARPDNFIIRKPQENKFNQLSLVLQGFGPAILALPGLLFLTKAMRWRLGALALFATMLWWLPEVAPGLIPTAGYRWAMLSLLSLQLIAGAAIAAAIAMVMDSKLERFPRRLGAIALIVVVGVLTWQAQALFDVYGKYAWPRYNKTISGTTKLEMFSEELKAREIVKGRVVANPWVSYALPAFGIESVNFGRKLIPVANQLIALYEEEKTPQNRQEIINGFGVRYFIVQQQADDVARQDFDEIAAPVFTKAGFTLYHLDEAP